MDLPEDVFAVLAEIAFYINRNIACQKLDGRSKENNVVRVGVIASRLPKIAFKKHASASADLKHGAGLALASVRPVGRSVELYVSKICDRTNQVALPVWRNTLGADILASHYLAF